MATFSRDSSNVPIEALSPGTSVTVAVGPAPVTTPVPYIIGQVIRITATVPVHLALGGAVASPNATLLPANAVEYFSIKQSGTSVSALSASGTGTINVTSME